MYESLNKQQIQKFIADGFVKIDNAFSSEIAGQARKILWNDLPGCNPNDSSTWTQPVIRLGMYNQEPFIKAANTVILHNAFDQLVGKDNWLPCMSMGSFPVRFPSTIDPGDTGWHVDAGFPGDDPNDFLKWRINIKSRGRVLLMLFLFSNVTALDAPTRILKGSHIHVAKLLSKAGDAGLSFMELAKRLDELPEREEEIARGEAGTVYLCHPFLVHGAQPHRGTEPRFMAQPPLLPGNKSDNLSPRSPVEEVMRIGLNS